VAVVFAIATNAAVDEEPLQANVNVNDGEDIEHGKNPSPELGPHVEDVEGVHEEEDMYALVGCGTLEPMTAAVVGIGAVVSSLQVRVEDNVM